MRFTWDPAKNQWNIRERGLAFGDAIAMWDAPMLVWIDTRKQHGENREIGLGVVDGRVIVAGWVSHSDDSVKIFTFRKANARETQRYKDFLQRQDRDAEKEERP